MRYRCPSGKTKTCWWNKTWFGRRGAYNEKIVAQEVGELLGQAIGHVKQLGAEADQEAFVCTIHGTLIRLVATRFTTSYLASLRTHHIPLTETLYVRRSKAYDFKTQEGRRTVLELCIGLLDGTYGVAMQKSASYRRSSNWKMNKKVWKHRNLLLILLLLTNAQRVPYSRNRPSGHQAHNAS